MHDLQVNMIARVNDIYTVVNWDEGRESEINGRGKLDLFSKSSKYPKLRFFNMGFSIKEIKILDKPDDSNLLFYNGGGIQTESGQKFWIPDLLLKVFLNFLKHQLFLRRCYFASKLEFE